MSTALIITLILMIGLLIVGVPIAISLTSSGLVGLYLAYGDGALTAVTQTMFNTVNSFLLLAVPLFILMGVILGRSEIGSKIYNIFDTFLRHIPGGIGIATILTCAVLAAMIGTSVAVAAMVGSFALTNLVKYGYKLSLSIGIIAAGGALGILIPPSVPMILYSAISMESAGKLFISGIIPGVLTIILFSSYIVIVSIRDQGSKKAPKASWEDRLKSLKEGFWALIIPFAIMFPLYLGIATPTEVAVIGVTWSLIVGLFIYKTIKFKDLFSIFKEGMDSSVMVLFVICGAMIFGNTVNQLGLPELILSTTSSITHPVWFVCVTVLVMLVLGMFIEGASIMLIALPLFLPALIALQVPLIWYAVIMVMAIEIGLLTPPVGLNIYAVDGVAKGLKLDSSLSDAIKGTFPFMIMYLIALLIVLFVPKLALWLPSVM